jgi:hypothetical protein
VPHPQHRFLVMPALIGWLLHAPLYYAVQPFVKRFFIKTIHYDSVLFVLLTLLYPFWLIVLGVLAFTVTANTAALGVVALAPLAARAFILWK